MRREDIRSAKARVFEAKAKDFLQLLELAGLDRAKHLRFANLQGVDFSGLDLTGCDFSGANIDGCNFVGASVASAIFDENQWSMSALRLAEDFHFARQDKLRRRSNNISDQSDRNSNDINPQLIVLAGAYFAKLRDPWSAQILLRAVSNARVGWLAVGGSRSIDRYNLMGRMIRWLVRSGELPTTAPMSRMGRQFDESAMKIIRKSGKKRHLHEAVTWAALSEWHTLFGELGKASGAFGNAMQLRRSRQAGDFVRRIAMIWATGLRLPKDALSAVDIDLVSEFENIVQYVSHGATLSEQIAIDNPPEFGLFWNLIDADQVLLRLQIGRYELESIVRRSIETYRQESASPVPRSHWHDFLELAPFNDPAAMVVWSETIPGDMPLERGAAQELSQFMRNGTRLASGRFPHTADLMRHLGRNRSAQ